MSKLFNRTEDVKLRLSNESIAAQFRDAKVLSLEAVQDYLASIKDAIGGLSNNLFDYTTDKAMLDATSRRHEVLSVVKRLHFADLADDVVTKPEGFDGKYLPYIHDLIKAADAAIPDTLQLLNNLKMAISSFINEYTEEGVLSVYGAGYAKQSEKLVEKTLSEISKYFPTGKPTFKSRVKDVLKNLGEVEGLFNAAPKLESVISHAKVQEVTKLSKEVAEMVDLLIEQNGKSGILLRNDTAKKDLVEMIAIGAKSVSLTGYLYANTMYLYKALESLSSVIIEAGKR